MKKEIIVKLHSDFEELVQREEDTGVEFWLARDIQNVLGYARADIIRKRIIWNYF